MTEFKDNPTQRWRTVRIFISSTFSDMHAERDHLVRFVFPELKEKCRKLHVHLIDVDLRWGVTEKEAQEGKALDICLDEIDSCRPYFLGLLGQRYGHIPSGHHHSITAQEIFHGVLHNELPKQVVDLRSIIEGRYEGRRLSNEQVNTLSKCYQFDGQKYTLKEDISSEEIDIIKSVVAQYSTYQRDRSFFFFRKESLTGQLAGDNTNAFFEDSPENQDKLKELKQEIIKEGLPHFEYDSIEKFGELVRDTLWSHIEKEIGETPKVEKDWLKEEDELHELFMADRTRRFVGRRDLLIKMDAFCRGERPFALGEGVLQNAPMTTTTESNLMVITGEPGCGKSALMACFTEELMHKHPDMIVIPHFIGASPSSTSLRLMLKRLCLRLNHASGSNEEAPEDIKELLKIFPETLKKAADQNKIVFIIDAVNQLEKTDNAHSIYWLPQELPENVCFIISTLAGDAHDALMRRRVKPVQETVHGLIPSDIEELIREYLKEIRKEFPNDNIKRAFFEKIKSGNPLYILVALEELRIFPRFEEVGSRIEELPDNMPALFDQVLLRVEGDFNRELVKDMMSFIACGRYGMRAEELQTLLRNHAPRLADSGPCLPAGRQAGMTESEVSKLPDMLWARLYRAFSAYLFERSGVIDFFHGQLKEAVGTRYLKEETDRDKVHKIIADYFETRWQEPYIQALDELPHQRTKAKDWNELEKLLTDFRFMKAKVFAFGPHPLIEDYDFAILPRLEASNGRIESQEKNLRLIQGALQLSAHILANDATQLAGQLIGRLLFSESPVILALLCQARQVQTSPWLRPLTQSLSQPGGPLLFILRGHSALVTSVALTSNGRYAVSGSVDKTLRVWDIETGEELHTLRGHRDAIRAVAVISDDRLAVSVSADEMIKVWDLESGAEIEDLESVTRDALCERNSNRLMLIYGKVNVITPDGRFSIDARNQQFSRESYKKYGALKICDLKRGVELGTVRVQEEISAIALTPDSRFALIGTYSGVLRIWNLDKLEETRVMMGHSSRIDVIKVTPDGRRAVTGSFDSTVCVWDLKTENEPIVVDKHKDRVTSVAIAPNGQYAVTASYDRTLKVWDLPSGKLLNTLAGHNSSIYAVAVSFDSSVVASVSGDRTFRVWDPETGEELLTRRSGAIMFTGVTSHYNRFLVSPATLYMTPDGRYIVTESSLRYLDLSTGEERRNLRGPFCGDVIDIIMVCDNFDDNYLTTDIPTLKVWDLESGELVSTLKGAKIDLDAFAITPDSHYAFSISEDGTFQFWDLKNGEELPTSEGVLGDPTAKHGRRFGAIEVMPDSRHVLLASWDTSFKIWNIEQRKVVAKFDGESPLTACAIAPDGVTIVIGELSGHVHFLTLEGLG